MDLNFAFFLEQSTIGYEMRNYVSATLWAEAVAGLDFLPFDGAESHISIILRFLSRSMPKFSGRIIWTCICSRSTWKYSDWEPLIILTWDSTVNSRNIREGIVEISESRNIRKKYFGYFILPSEAETTKHRYWESLAQDGMIW